MRVRNNVDEMERETVKMVVVGPPECLPLEAEPITDSARPVPGCGTPEHEPVPGCGAPEHEPVPGCGAPEHEPVPGRGAPANTDDGRVIPEYLKKYFGYKADVLGPGCLAVISQTLAQRVVGFSERHFQKDWTGLAEFLGGYSVHEVDCFKGTSNPPESLLVDWRARSGSTVRILLEGLHDIGRFDLLEGEALRRTLETSVKNYEERLRMTIECEDQPRPPMQTIQPPPARTNTVPATLRQPNEMAPIVVDDVGQIFDAFVCYTHADGAFLGEMISELEDKRGLKLCINSRDLLGGTAKYVVTAELIEHRCKRIVVVLSENFLSQGKSDNPECEFQLRFGQSLSPGAHQNILIPVVIDSCRLPSFLNHISPLTYDADPHHKSFFWRRLAASLGAPLVDVEAANHREAFKQLCLRLDPEETVERAELTVATDCADVEAGPDTDDSCVPVVVHPSVSSRSTAPTNSNTSCVAVTILPDSSCSSPNTSAQSQSSPSVTVVTTSSAQSSKSTSSKPPKKTKNKIAGFFKRKKEG